MKRQRCPRALLGVALFLLLCANPAPAADDKDAADKTVENGSLADGEQITWQVVSSGATRSASASYQLSGTVGQAAVGLSGSTSHVLNQGYWQNFSLESCCQLRGDVDNSGSINVSDLTYLVALLFQGGPPAVCADESDVDGSGSINVSDLTYLVAGLFQGGPLPPAC